MATSAQTLTMIIDEIVKNKLTNRDAAIKHLAAKGLLPKKMTAPAPVKKVSVFASKQAEDFAEAQNITVPTGFKGTAANDKISVKDLKGLADGPKKTSPKASPSAQQYARDNGLDLAKVAGTGPDGKILLKDIKNSPRKTEEAKAKISPSAAKLMKQWNISEDDITDIEGTGKDGTVKAADLKELIDMIKAEGSDDESEGESDSEDEA
jgi:pyruvate dehydrogenase E2 component (dihydrolipoamide acetyltransferase)